VGWCGGGGGGLERVCSNCGGGWASVLLGAGSGGGCGGGVGRGGFEVWWAEGVVLRGRFVDSWSLLRGSRGLASIGRTTGVGSP